MKGTWHGLRGVKSEDLGLRKCGRKRVPLKKQSEHLSKI